MNIKRESVLLYAVTDRSWLCGDTLCSQVKKALNGGVTAVQLREKDLGRESFIEEAFKIGKLCREYSVPFIINDNVEIAKIVNADGVHLGQGDMPVCKAREILGDDKIIGVSAHNVEQALLAQKDGADYLGCGASFPTGSKSDAGVIGVDTIKNICSAVSIPVAAIGGINEDNILKLSGSGIDGVAVISAIFAREDITLAAKTLKKLAERVTSHDKRRDI